MKKNSSLKKLLGSREALLAVLIIALCLIIQIKSPTFLTPTSITDLLKNNAVTMLMALGMLCVLLVGGIDISIAANSAFCAVSMGMLCKYGYVSNTFLMILIATAMGTVCGLLIGLIVGKGHVVPIIATLGFMYIYRGLAYVVANNKWASATDYETFKDFALSSYLGFGIINNVLMVVLVIYIIFFIVMKWTTFGRRIYAVGSNAAAAQVSGINTDNVKIYVHTIMGALAGLGGALASSVYASSQPNMMTGGEMNVIAACVIGGVSMSGGRGSVVGVFLGALSLAIINKGMPLVGIDSLAQNTVQGVIILVVVVMNVLLQRSSEMAALKRREM